MEASDVLVSACLVWRLSIETRIQSALNAALLCLGVLRSCYVNGFCT